MVTDDTAAGNGQIQANKQVRQRDTVEGFWAKVEEGGTCMPVVVSSDILSRLLPAREKLCIST